VPLFLLFPRWPREGFFVYLPDTCGHFFFVFFLISFALFLAFIVLLRLTFTRSHPFSRSPGAFALPQASPFLLPVCCPFHSLSVMSVHFHIDLGGPVFGADRLFTLVRGGLLRAAIWKSRSMPLEHLSSVPIQPPASHCLESSLYDNVPRFPCSRFSS